MHYLGTIVDSALSIVFFVFVIAAVGYLLGAIDVKGVSLGTAGVLFAALAFGILTCFVPSFTLGGKKIALFSDTIKREYDLISNIGTAMFVTSMGIIAGPRFFRSLNRSSISYIVIGIVTILAGVLVTVICILADKSLSPSMAVGLMTGALTSAPALSAVKEISIEADLVIDGYEIAYLFGLLGVVLFVQLMPKILRLNKKEEIRRFIAADTVKTTVLSDDLKRIDPFSVFPFALAVTLGCIIGAIKIPGIKFSLGNSGGCLISGLIIGHFGHMGKIDLRIQESTLNLLRELGLVLFLIGAGVPAGVNFLSSIKLSYFFYGVAMTLVPMVISFFVATKLFKLGVYNSLGSIVGGMTSTALGALIRTAGKDEVASSYAATYPVALVFVVIFSKLILLIF